MSGVASTDGWYLSDGSWQAGHGSKFRSLHKDEVADFKRMAESTTPSFEGPNNAPWEDHHPVCREVWEKRGVGPKTEETTQ